MNNFETLSANTEKSLKISGVSLIKKILKKNLKELEKIA